MALGSTNACGGSGKSEIIVAAPTGSTVTATCGSIVKRAAEKNGMWLFRGCGPGKWTLTATHPDEDRPATDDLEISETGQLLRYYVKLHFVQINGISRDIAQPPTVWTRTDMAVGLTATASVGTKAGHSDFDGVMPWAGIKRETLPTGDVMVKIPKFYFRRYREGNIEHIKIADKPKDGFKLHPLFCHAGAESECVYVGAYKTSVGAKSLPSQAPQGNKTRAGFRSDAKSKGDGWGIVDIAAASAIRMLILTEFADNNVQSVIGRGYCDGNTGALSCGSCDNVPNLTGRPAGTDGKTDIVWRGIEGLWGNMWELVDGINWYNSNYYVCNDPAMYADDTADGYASLSFQGSAGWNTAFIAEEGVDVGENNHVMMPEHAMGGSESTYYCDAVWASAGWATVAVGGAWSDGSVCGLFETDLTAASSRSDVSMGSRLMYIPPKA